MARYAHRSVFEEVVPVRTIKTGFIGAGVATVREFAVAPYAGDFRAMEQIADQVRMEVLKEREVAIAAISLPTGVRSRIGIGGIGVVVVCCVFVFCLLWVVFVVL